MFRASCIRNTSSFGADHIRQTKETWEFSDDEFDQELKALLNEGIIEKSDSSDGDYFHATKKGLIAKERNYQDRGLRHPVLYNKTVELSHLIVALMSCDDYYGGEALEHSEFDIEKLPVYLWFCDDKDIHQAVNSLLNENIIKKSNIDIWGERYYLTAAARIKYSKQIAPLLGLSPPTTILDKPSPPVPKFSGKYSDNLEYRWIEAEKCQDCGLWLSATAMYGSILETVLIGALKRQGNAALSSKSAPTNEPLVENWRLDTLIKASEELQLVDKSLAKYAHVLRDARNLIHPSKQIKENHYPTGESTKIAQQVVRSVLDNIFHKP